MTANRQLTREAGLGATCSRCGKTYAAESGSCPSCSAELGGATDLDNVHTAGTAPIGLRGGRPATTSESDVIASEARLEIAAPTARSSSSSTSSTDPASEHLTVVTARDSKDIEPPSAFVDQRSAGAKSATALNGTRSRSASAHSSNDTHELADDEVGTIVRSKADQVGLLTAQAARKPSVAESVLTLGGSSDPPTRFLRGLDHHIELPNGSMVDDYEIDGKVGQGAMGVVYSAQHVKLGRRVAMKVIAPSMGGDPQALARFEREARTLASLHHPNIVDVSAFGTLPDERSYFVMEYLVGNPLDETLERGRMPLEEALDVLDQIARGLDAAHAQGIVHRDLKPSNTFLVRIPREPRPIVKLLDFGLVKTANADGVKKTATGAVIGTALYLSPEQCRGPDVDGRTDIYALGCIAYELVLGRHPFPEATTTIAAIAAHMTEVPPQPRSIWPGIPAALDLLLFSMLAKDPSYRPTLTQIRHVIASVRSPATFDGRAMRAATEVVAPSASYARGGIAALILFALVVGIAFGASVLGAPSDNDRGPRPAAITSNLSDTSEAPSQLEPETSPEMTTAATIDAALSDGRSPDAPVIADASVPLTTDARATPDVIAAPPELGSRTPSEDIEQQSAPAPTTPSRSLPRVSSSQSSTTATASATGGALSLESRPSADVLIDGVLVGRTPIVGRRLSAGRHKITLTNTTFAIRESFRIQIRPGQVEKIFKDYWDEIPEAKKPSANPTIDPFAKKKGTR